MAQGLGGAGGGRPGRFGNRWTRRSRMGRDVQAAGRPAAGGQSWQDFHRRRAVYQHLDAGGKCIAKGDTGLRAGLTARSTRPSPGVAPMICRGARASRGMCRLMPRPTPDRAGGGGLSAGVHILGGSRAAAHPFPPPQDQSFYPGAGEGGGLVRVVQACGCRAGLCPMLCLHRKRISCARGGTASAM